MNVKDKVIAILEEQLGFPKGEVLLTSTKVSLCMDSLDEIETIMALEEEFDIEINDYQAEKFKSVRDIVDFIKANQLCNTMSALAYNDAKVVFSEVYKGKSIHDVVGVNKYPLSYTYEQLEGKDLVAHKDGYMDEDKSLFCKKGNIYKIDLMTKKELSFIDEAGDDHNWDLYDVGEYFYPIDKVRDNLYNPVKDISYAKYLRCTDRLPAKIFNSDQGCLWMYKSSCGKYYYWEEYNCANKVIYRRGEVDWVECNYEEYDVEDSKWNYTQFVCVDNTAKRGLSDIINSLDNTKRIKLEGTIEDKKSTLLNDLTQSTTKPIKGNTINPKTEWTDKHYDFVYKHPVTRGDSDVGYVEIKVDPYFVAKQWRLGSKDDSGALWHTFKGIARFGEKNSVEREIRAFHAQIKRLAELNGVDLT